MEKWRALMEERGTRPDVPMKPQVVARELGKRLPDERHRHLRLRHDRDLVGAARCPVKRGQMHTLSGTLATMANGFPYAIAAQIAYPDRPVRRVRRRRRLLDADGRARDLREVQPAASRS